MPVLPLKITQKPAGWTGNVAGIRQQSYDNLAGVLRTLGQLNSSPQSSTGGNTYEQTLAVSELARGFKCILVCYTNNFVVNLGIEYIRNKAGADTLNLMRAALAGGQYRGGIRLNSYYLDIRVLILQVLAGAGYGAARCLRLQRRYQPCDRTAPRSRDRWLRSVQPGLPGLRTDQG